MREHFEALFLLYLWANASALAVIAGRPAIGAVGLVTVLPFLIAYVARGKSGPRGS